MPRSAHVLDSASTAGARRGRRRRSCPEARDHAQVVLGMGRARRPLRRRRTLSSGCWTSGCRCRRAPSLRTSDLSATPRAPATALRKPRAASGAKPPRNTDSRASTSRSTVPRCFDWSKPPRARRARDATRRVRSSSFAQLMRDASRARVTCGELERGNPSTRRQMSRIAAAASVPARAQLDALRGTHEQAHGVERLEGRRPRVGPRRPESGATRRAARDLRGVTGSFTRGHASRCAGASPRPRDCSNYRARAASRARAGGR